MADTPLIPLALLGAGGYLAWFGVHYWKSDTAWPSAPIKAVLTGKPAPAPGASTAQQQDLTAVWTQADALAAQNAAAANQANTLGTPSLVLPGTNTGSAIANAALKYNGAGYVYGGPADRPGDWDCSSFVSYVLGHDLGIALPGGKWGDPGFPPHAHGPTTLSYMLYGQGVEVTQVQAGDLIVSTEHMGIAISQSQMISAQDQALGTGVSFFPAGFPGGPPIYRRITQYGPFTGAG